MYNKIKDKKGIGCSIWSIDARGFMLLLKEMFEDFPSHKVVVMPHKSNAAYLKTMTIGSTIRNYYNLGTPLVIKISDVDSKIRSLYDKLGIIDG